LSICDIREFRGLIVQLLIEMPFTFDARIYLIKDIPQRIGQHLLAFYFKLMFLRIAAFIEYILHETIDIVMERLDNIFPPNGIDRLL